MFNSKADADRHELLVHFGERRKDQQLKRKAPAAKTQQVFKCNYNTEDGPCAFEAPSAYYLREHKNKTGHKKAYTKKGGI